MKKLIIFLIFSAFVGMQMSAQSPPVCDDFVTLQGKYFQCGGELFYPLATTYSFHAVYNSDTYVDYDDIYLSRNNGYGPRVQDPGMCYGYGAYEGCNANYSRFQILNDFQRIHEMGFNTIRTTFGPNFKDSYPNTTMVLECAQCTPMDWNKKMEITAGVNDPGRDRLFDFFDEILQIAHDKGLKVFLDIAYEKMTDDVHFPAYLDYLELLAQHISQLDIHKRQTLIAYVILEESEYTQSDFSKSVICGKVSEMYDVLKANDPEHLVSVGGLEIGDVMQWDPGIMKLDFWCPHLYPTPKPDMGELDADHSVERIIGQLYWLKNNCPLPWVIGECGFGATDDNIGRNDADYDGWPYEWNCGPLHYPIVNGELETPYSNEIYTQTTFAETILKTVRDCGGSGFTMWDFQECWAASITDLPKRLPDVNGDCHGLLKHGEATSNTADILGTIYKPVVSVFQNYLDNGQPPAIDVNGGQPPTNYFNPFNHPVRNNVGCLSTRYHHVLGFVLDTDDNPIKDAFVCAWCNLGRPDLDADNEFEYIYTFTNDQGYFTLDAMNHMNGYLQSKDYITDIKVSAPGASVAPNGWWDAIPELLVVVLSKPNVVADVILNGITIINGQSEEYVAWNTITAEDVTVQANATAQFKAMNEIQLNQDFNANYGSEVHMWCTQIFPSCSDFGNYKSNNSSTGLQSETLLESNEIELKFQKELNPNSINIDPNPSAGVFNISYFSEDQSIITHLIVFEMTGRIIGEYAVNGNKYLLDLTGNPKGVYFIKITDSEMRDYIKKIILN